MNAFENARKFFDACEASAGWAGCKPYMVNGASFVAQSEPLDYHIRYLHPKATPAR
jgi:hypothetical protein